MTVLDRIPSAVRFLTPAQQREHAPVPSELAIADIARRMGVRPPKAAHG